jgi:cell division control protein 6
MYVSGPPGTGKSALVEEVCRGLDGEKRVKVANINCASMTTARDIYGRLIEELCDDTSQVFRKGEVERLRGMFLPRKGSSDHLYLVTLDEIDHLLTTDLEILYTFFEWSLQRNSRLVLIGIANALDLTDRFLPRLKAKNLKPQLLPFLPYTPPQITKVITTLLRSLLPSDSVAGDDFVPFLQPAAIQLCSRKVASQSGDLRKAFDLVRRTLDIIERETLDKANSGPSSPSKAPLAENVNMSSMISPPDTPVRKMAEYTAATAPRATVAHVARVTSAAFSNGTTERLHGLNLQQKAALCALVSFGRRQRTVQQVPATPTKSPRSNAPTAKQLFDTYSALCRRDNMLHPLTATEFRDILSNLETMGLVGEVQERGRGRAATGPMGFLTPSRLGRGAGGSPLKNGGHDTGLVCFVSEKELETRITGPGEGVLKALLREEL